MGPVTQHDFNPNFHSSYSLQSVTQGITLASLFVILLPFSSHDKSPDSIESRVGDVEAVYLLGSFMSLLEKNVEIKI